MEACVLMSNSRRKGSGLLGYTLVLTFNSNSTFMFKLFVPNPWRDSEHVVSACFDALIQKPDFFLLLFLISKAGLCCLGSLPSCEWLPHSHPRSHDRWPSRAGVYEERFLNSMEKCGHIQRKV